MIKHICIYIATLLLFTNINYSSAQVIYFGSCPTYPLQQDFNITLFLGTWFEAEKYPTISTLGTKCVTSRWTDATNGNYHVFNQQIIPASNQEDSIYGYATVGGNAILDVTLPTAPSYTTTRYYVLSTDYTNYATLYACTDHSGVFNARYIYVYTGRRHPAPETLQMAYQSLDYRNIDRSNLRRTQQSSCEDYVYQDILLPSVPNKK